MLDSKAVMKFFLAIATLAAAALLAGCAQGGSGPSQSGASGITMYGTIDEGISIRK
jgi:hypothetical protein